MNALKSPNSLSINHAPKHPYIPFGINQDPLPAAGIRESKVEALSSSPIELAAVGKATIGTDLAARSSQSFGVMSPPVVVSPVDRLWWLRDGWDGGRAERLSRTVLRHACAVWRLAKELTPDDLPRVTPSPDAYVFFSWSDHHPMKELQLSVFDKKNLDCKWVLRGRIGKESGLCDTTDSLKIVLSRYQHFDDGQ